MSTNQIDKVAVGGFAGAAAMGRYDVARDVAISPSQELIKPDRRHPHARHGEGPERSGKRRELYLSTLACRRSSARRPASAGADRRRYADLVLGPKWQ